ncbi:PspA/IM30 family protein [Leptolyngbya sp. AN02str]|uniref:PspA/IM30 family protein n=1 Tax=Leptolyngbya sp. AN02str TaxID=3423363 RepID=UPI003D31B690
MKPLFYWLLGERTLRGVVYWLLGDRAAQTLIALWNWVWGIPLEAGGKLSVEAAQESLYAMQQAVQQLTESVAQMTASYQRVQQKYSAKQQEFQDIQQQAFLAQQQGHVEAARMAMRKAILIERVLPTLAEQVTQAEQILSAHQDRLRREKQHLETYQLEMQHLKDLSEVSEALKTITRINQSFEVRSSRSQFETAQSSIQRRYLRNHALVELSESSTETLTADLEKLTLDDVIHERLQHSPLTLEQQETSHDPPC